MLLFSLPYPCQSVLALGVTILLITGCDFSGDTDRTIGGVNITELFEPPSPEEVDAVRAEWAKRDVSVQNFERFGESSVELANGAFEISLVSHTVNGVKHVGAFVVPAEADGPLAVLVYTHGDDRGVSMEDEVFVLIEALEDMAQEFAIVVPSFRSEDLRLGGVSYASGGDSSPWDRDVDDSLALLNAALQEIPEADASRIGVVGFSRGAAVAKLMATRDERIDAVVSFFGPTDFYGPWAQNFVEEALRGTILPLPGVRPLVENYIFPLQQGNLSKDDVRHEMTRRSIVFFVNALPAIQLHHGEDDFVVPIGEATRFRRTMENIGRQPSDDGDFQFFLYPSDPPYDTELRQHSPDGLSGSVERTLSFLREFVLGAIPTEE